MPKFKRQITTSFSAFQFKRIELSEREAKLPSTKQSFVQSEKQWTAFKEAEIPVKLRDIGFAHFSEDKPLTLIVNISVPGLAGSFNHFMAEGDWLVIDPMGERASGRVISDERFRELGAVQV